MTYATAIVKPRGVVIRGTYHGGEYIDLHWGGTKYDPGPSFEVINVWDAEADRARIEPTREALLAEMNAWVAANVAIEKEEGGRGYEWLDSYLLNTR